MNEQDWQDWREKRRASGQSFLCPFGQSTSCRAEQCMLYDAETARCAYLVQAREAVYRNELLTTLVEVLVYSQVHDNEDRHIYVANIHEAGRRR